MKKVAILLVVFAAWCAVVSLTLTHTGPGRAALQLLARARACRHAAVLGPATVLADEMKWTPVPGESASTTPRRRARAVSPAPAEPPPAEAPAEPPSDATAPGKVVRSGDVMRVGSDIHVERDEVVRGSVSAIGGDVVVDGHVEGDVTAMRGDVYLGPTARVDGDVVSVGGQLHEEPGAYVRGQRVTAMPGSRLGRLRSLPRHDEVELHTARMIGAFIWVSLLLGVAWAIAQLAPGRTREAVGTLRRGPLSAIGLGGMILALVIPSLIALSLLVAFLCITIIGIPLALAAMLGYGLFLLAFVVWGLVVSAAALGEAILARRGARVAGVVPAYSPASLSRAAIVGMVVLAGPLLIGKIFGMSIMPARALGGFLFVISIVALSFASVVGGGAWLRSEFATGTFGRWWQKRKAAPRPVTPPPGSSAPPAAGVAPPPPPPPAPSPPSAFAPPAPPEPPAAV